MSGEPDPSLAQFHQDVIARFKLEERLRVVEVEQASTRAVLAELPRMEGRLSAQIAELKSKTPWPTVMAILGIVTLVVTIIVATRAGAA